MKKLLLVLLLLAPFSASAVSVGWDRFVSGGLRTLYSGDKVLIGATATSTNNNLEVVGTASVSGAFTSATVDTGQGANELYDMNQNVLTTSDTIFNSVSVSSNAGVRLTGDGDGAITFLGLGDGFDESITMNLDDTTNTLTWSSATGIALIESPSITQQSGAFRTSGVGTETVPTYSFSSDTNTGIYKTSSGEANSLSITTGGVQRVVVDSSGNVGIATTTPVARLEAWGTSSGTILNLFTSAGVKVLEVLNTGVATALGSWDFGGATFLEIPNGTNPTANDVGEIAHDTTDNQLILDDYVLPTTQKLWSATVASSSVDFVSGGRIPIPMIRDGITITEISCFVDGGTSVVINIDSLAGGAQTDTLTCDADGATDSSQSQNTTRAANSLNVVEFGTVTGSVDYVSFTVSGTYTRE